MEITRFNLCNIQEFVASPSKVATFNAHFHFLGCVAYGNLELVQENVVVAKKIECLLETSALVIEIYTKIFHSVLCH